jgi:tRNA pseudouridine38-40 synthase
VLKQDRKTYLIHIQYLGIRLHGWAKQTGLKTVHERIDKSIAFVFGHSEFKTMGSSRTDAKVSANTANFALMVSRFLNENEFLKELNNNLPPDIKALSVALQKDGFNALQPDKIKTYLYLFAFNQKAHPFSSALMTTVLYDLDIELMKRGAELFNGEHDFCNYVTKPNDNTQTNRFVLESKVMVNTFYNANFFPEKSFAFVISSKGFMRNQVRLIMGQLFKLGKGETDLDFIEHSLKARLEKPLREIAPSSGLILQGLD